MEGIGFVVPPEAVVPVSGSGYVRHSIGFEAPLARRPVEPEESAYSESSIGFSVPLRG